MSLSVHEIRDEKSCLAFLPDWERLHEQSGCGHIHSSPTWLLGWWKRFGVGKRLRILVVREDGQGAPLAILPLCDHLRSGGRLESALRVREIQQMGVHFVDACQILGSKEMALQAAPILAQHLAAAKDWQVLQLRHLLDDTEVPISLQSAFQREHLETTLEPIDVSPFLPLSGSFEDCYAQLGSKWRYDIERNLRRLKAMSTGPLIEIKREITSDDLSALRTLNEARAAAGDARRSPLLDPQRFAFLQDMLAPLNERRWWRLATLRIQGALAAYQLGFVVGGVYYFWSIAHHPDHASYSVGKVLLRLNLEACFQEGLHTFDFMAGGESYKDVWTTHQRRNLALTVRRDHWKLRLLDLWQRRRAPKPL